MTATPHRLWTLAVNDGRTWMRSGITAFIADEAEALRATRDTMGATAPLFIQPRGCDWRVIDKECGLRAEWRPLTAEEIAERAGERCPECGSDDDYAHEHRCDLCGYRWTAEHPEAGEFEDIELSRDAMDYLAQRFDLPTFAPIIVEAGRVNAGGMDRGWAIDIEADAEEWHLAHATDHNRH